LVQDHHVRGKLSRPHDEMFDETAQRLIDEDGEPT
jgi:hypothetical protein